MRQRVAIVLSLLVSAAMTWGLYNAALSGICFLRDGDVVCTPDRGGYGAVYWVGFLVQFALFFAGARLVAMAGIFASAGVALTLAGTVGSDRGGSSEHLGMGVTFLVGIVGLGLLFLLLASVVRNKTAALVSRGAEAIATCLSVEDTGGTVNHNPRLRMRFRIEPLDGVTPAFEAEKTAVVPRIDIPRRGDRYPAWYDPADPTKWAFGAGTPGEGSDPKAVRLWELAKNGASVPLPPPVRTDSDVVAEMSRLNARRVRGEIDDDEFTRRVAALVEPADGRV